MRINARLVSSGVVAVAMTGVLGLLLMSTPVAQNRQAAANSDTRPTPRLSNGKPDFSGFYGGRRGDETQGPNASELTRTENGSAIFEYGGANDGGAMPVLKETPTQPADKPEYMAKVNARADTMYGGNSNEDPDLDCKPSGVVRSGIGGGIVMHTPEALAVLYEASPGPYWRIIYTDGRQHP